MPELTVNGITIDDTFAEAFDMRATAIVITAPTERWAAQAATTMTGFATSVIACGCEASVESILAPEQTPDGRPGVRVLLFAVSTAELQKQLQNRVGQCVLTSPGSACYAGLDFRRRQAKARRRHSFLRRRLADRQTARRSAILARAGDGRRIRLRIDHLLSPRRRSAAAISLSWARPRKRLSPRPRKR